VAGFSDGQVLLQSSNGITAADIATTGSLKIGAPVALRGDMAISTPHREELRTPLKRKVEAGPEILLMPGLQSLWGFNPADRLATEHLTPWLAAPPVDNGRLLAQNVIRYLGKNFEDRLTDLAVLPQDPQSGETEFFPGGYTSTGSRIPFWWDFPESGAGNVQGAARFHPGIYNYRTGQELFANPIDDQTPRSRLLAFAPLMSSGDNIVWDCHTSVEYWAVTGELSRVLAGVNKGKPLILEVDQYFSTANFSPIYYQGNAPGITEIDLSRWPGKLLKASIERSFRLLGVKGVRVGLSVVNYENAQPHDYVTWTVVGDSKVYSEIGIIYGNPSRLIFSDRFSYFHYDLSTATTPYKVEVRDQLGRPISVTFKSPTKAKPLQADLDYIVTHRKIFSGITEAKADL
jgi:hypothetical protein